MTIQEFGSLGEVIGGIAVVLSLIYLAVQIRQNTRSTRAATIQSVFSQAASFSAVLGASTHASRVWRLGMFAPDELDEDETVQFMSQAMQMMRSFENAYIQFQSEPRDDVAWEPWALSIRNLFATPGLRTFWQTRSKVFSRDFRRYIDTVVASEPALAPGSSVGIGGVA